MKSLILVLLFAVCCSRAQQGTQIFINANIYTGVKDASGKVRRAKAMVVENDRIQAIDPQFGATIVKVIDLQGKFVMPGFNDAHCHLASGGFEKLNVNLVGSKSLDEMRSRIAERAKSAGAGDWMVGQGWDHTLWVSQALPTRQDLDAVSAGHPAIFTRVDGHIAVANSAALQAAGISQKTTDPSGGKVDRDANGEATGILRETAKELVLRKVPRPTAGQRRRAAELALADAAKWGVTSAQDNSEWEDFLVYEQLEREGKLTLRISEWLPFKAEVKRLQDHRVYHDGKDLMLHTGMLKGFMDGSLGSRTAALLEPYSDDPGNSGLPQYAQEQLNRMTVERAAAGFQAGFHAIGEKGSAMALEAFGLAMDVAKKQGFPTPSGQPLDFRFRIEHDQVIAPEQFAKYKASHVIASVQPSHLLTDMNWAEARIGAQRAKHSYPWAEFQQNGVRLAFGTDYPVEPINPFRGLYAAVTRKNEAGTKSYYPEQKLSLDDAIAAYTTGSAYAEFAENEKGTLATGKLADFVVLDRDITAANPSEILKTTVLRTVVGGKTVYQAK